MRGRSRVLVLIAGMVVLALTLSSAEARTGSGRASHQHSVVDALATGEAESVPEPEDEFGAADCPGAVPDRLRSPRLPWPVVFTTSCGRFVLFSDGRLARLPVVAMPAPWYRVSAGLHAWAEVRHGHVVFTSRGRVAWRSRGTYDRLGLGSAVLGPTWVAFSIYSSSGETSDLYLSALGSSEWPVANNEGAVAPTASGDLIVSQWRSDGTEPGLQVRRPDGKLAGVIARGVSASYPEPESGTLLLQRGPMLWRTDGIRSWPLKRLDALGVPGLEWIDRLEDGRILVTGRRSVAVLDREGRLKEHATLAPIPRGGAGYVSVAMQELETGMTLRVHPSNGGLLVTQAVWRDANAGGGPGWEGLYELLPGASSARLLFGAPLELAVCAHDSRASWHGDWLLYAACEGRVVVVDATGHHSPIDLSDVARAIPIPKEERGYGLWGAEWALFAAPAGMPGPGRLDEAAPAWMS